jgi:MHS family proline/betaine transporter-like MFS transporter
MRLPAKMQAMALELTPHQRRAAAAAAFVGNLVVWYDFALYGYLASQLGQAFFPDDSPELSLLASFGVFAIGFLMRPLGSVVLGPLGDLLGRRPLLSLCTVLMGASCLLIALLPTHAQLGLLATTALVGLRMLQGIAVGADLTSSISTATEAAGNARAGLLASLAVAGGHLGFCLCSLVVALTSVAVRSFALEPTWTWRLPFLLGALATAVGLWMREQMPETLPPLVQAPTLTRPLGLLKATARHLREARDSGAWVCR